MAATSVTGVGPNKGSEHMTLGVSRLIGSRWDETKEKKLNSLVRVVWALVVTQMATLLALGFIILRLK